MDELYTKRGCVWLRDGELTVGGAFARTPVPTDAEASCTDVERHGPGTVLRPSDGCWCGFNAHVRRVETLRYAPLRNPVLVVELGGAVAAPAPNVVIGRRQRVVAIEWFPYCGTAAWEAVGFARADDGTLTSACAEHGELSSADLDVVSRDVVVNEPGRRRHAPPQH